MSYFSNAFIFNLLTHSCAPRGTPNPFTINNFPAFAMQRRGIVVSSKSPFKRRTPATVHGSLRTDSSLFLVRSAVDWSKSFRIRTCKETPRFARFWPKLSARNSFRFHTCKKLVCKPFRMHTYKKAGGHTLAIPSPFAFSPREPNNERGAKSQARCSPFSSFAFRVSFFEVSICLKP